MLGREEGEDPRRAHALEVGGQRGQEERAAGPHHEHDEAHVVAELAQDGGEAPDPGVAAAAGEALRVVHPDEGAARRTEHGGRPIHSIGHSSVHPSPP